MDAARKFLDPSQVQVVIHHSPCDDGHASAAIFHGNLRGNVLLIGMHPSALFFGNDNAIVEQIRNCNVVMVDIAFSREVLVEAAKLAKRILILDHHVTNQSTLHDPIAENVHTHFVMGRAGVHLAWEYVHADFPISRAFDYIGLKDVWQHERHLEALYFTTAFVRPETWDGWDGYFHQTGLVDEVIARGKVIYDYQRQVLKIMAEKAQVTQWRNYRVVIINAVYPWTSDIGKMLCEEQPDETVALIWSKMPTGPFSVSLRSNDACGPNVAIIAEEFGGGGHEHAAALRIDRAPYEIFSDTGNFE